MAGNQDRQESSQGSVATDPWLGAVVGDRYSVEARLGQGGMGVVYRARHLDLGKPFAIKRLDPIIARDPLSYERFRREALALSRIQSPHVVHVFDWGKAPDGSPYLVMELLEGGDLRALMRREGRLLALEATNVISQVLRALICTHQAEVVHRDLKPENVFLCRDESDELWVKLLDFGISKRVAENREAEPVTRSGTIVGTAFYMSPEQARAESMIDARSDLYSVGAMLYEALSGQVPHRGRTFESTLVDICTRDAEDVRLHAPLVPEAMAKIVAKSLRRNPDERFQTAKEFLEALVHADKMNRVESVETMAAGPSVSHAQVRAPDERDLPALKPGRPSRRGWLLGLGLLLTVTAAVGLFANRLRPSSAPMAPPEVPASARTLAKALLPTVPLPSVQAVAKALAPPAPQSSARPSTPTLPSSGSRNNTQRQSANSSSKPQPTALPGVASELKLRRTMP